MKVRFINISITKLEGSLKILLLDLDETLVHACGPREVPEV